MSADLAAGRLAGKVVLVTGAASGIGSAMARRFIAEGAKVACAELNRAGLDALVAELGAVALAVPCDVTDPASAKAAVGAAVAAFGRLDALVNNAAAPSTSATVVELDPADWHRELAVSLTGAFLMSKAAVPAIAAAGAAASSTSPRSSAMSEPDARSPTAPPRPGSSTSRG